MSYESMTIETLTELLEEHNIKADNDVIAQIAKDFADSLEMEREVEMNRHLPSLNSKCQKCKKLEKEIDRLENRERILKKHIAPGFKQYVTIDERRERVEIEYGLI